MIINEYAGSGVDALPLYFRRRGLGKLVGKRTWGGLIGIFGYPGLIDGGRVTAPRLAIYSADGKEWDAENVGISPDIEVEMTPKLVIEGKNRLFGIKYGNGESIENVSQLPLPSLLSTLLLFWFIIL